MTDSLPRIRESSFQANIQYRGRLLYPERGPLRHAQRLALAYEPEPARLHLLASPGLWYGLAELLASLPADSAVLAIEADPALAALSRSCLPEGLAASTRFAFVEGLDPGALVGAARRLGRFRRVRLVRLSGGAAFSPGAYEKAEALLNEDFSAFWKNRVSLMAMGRLWVRNIFRNLSRLDEIAPEPLSPFRKPVLLCGAGPSLELVLPLLHRCRNLLDLVAVDTAVGPLVQAGYLPDLVVCLEAQIWNLRDFLPLEGRAVPLLADLSSHPASFKAAGGRTHLSLTAIEEGPFLRRLGALPLPFLSLPPLGSVGVHALEVVLGLAEAPVLISGLDFAWPVGQSHARGAPALLAAEHRRGRLCGEADFNGSFRIEAQRTPSGWLCDPVLSRYAALASELVAARKALAPGQLLDLRGTGGLDLGLRRLSPEEALALILSFPPPEADPQSAGPPLPNMATPASDATLLRSIGRSFLGSELRQLIGIESILRGRLPHPGNTALRELIASCDYLLWTQPDAHRLGELPQDLLNRILVEVAYWSGLLGELLRG
ncbi:MAG: 6-hydroxymethylpterin diphosphokinase MptE-like protein [Spirochaetota bacterium]